MRDKIQNAIAYAVITFIYILSLIYGIDAIKRLGRKLEKYEEK